MTLRGKTLLVTGGAIVSSLLALLAISSTILMRPFAALEEEAARRTAGAARSAMLAEVSTLGAIAGLIATIVALLLLERAVLSRLGRLNSSITQIAASGDLSTSVPVSGHDEISQVAEAMNRMLAALDRSQRDLRQSEERYRAFVEQSSEAVWRLELEQPLPITLPEDEQVEGLMRGAHIAEANEIAARMYGFAHAADVLGIRLGEVLAATVGLRIEHIRAFIRGGYRLTDATLEQPGPDGTTRHLLTQVVGIVENEALVRVWGLQRDIAARIDAEAKLRMQVSAINAASDQILITGPDGIVEFVNDAFARETGFTAGDLVGQSVRVLESGRHEPSFYDSLWSSLAEGKSWQGEIISRRKDGSTFTADTVITPVRNDQGVIEHYISIKRDVTKKKVYEQQLDHLAHHDSLTGLPNRLLLNDRLTQRLSYAQQQDESLAVMFLDLDHFKFINDTLGHSMGDLLLKLAAERLKRLLRDVDTIARTGGDEFTIILSGVSSPEEAAAVARRILHAFADPFALDGNELFVSTSVGISIYPADGIDAETLVKHADTAMYRAKEQGRNNYQFFTRALSAAAVERMSLESSLRKALERDEFEIYYQPRMDIALETVLGAEALLRWHQPDRGLVYPAQFIPIAEETGLIVPITEWVLRQACAQGKAWQTEGRPPITVEVNISAREFHHHDLVATIQAALDSAGLDPHCLGLEITENALMRSPELAIRALHRLSAMGIRLLIDDFGTGHSSLSHLKRFPIDAVKIDRSFVANVTHNPDDAAIAAAIVAMAHSLKLKVTAEGVETRDQLDFLRSIGCDEIQGYLVTEPIPAAEFTKLLNHRFALTAP